MTDKYLQEDLDNIAGCMSEFDEICQKTILVTGSTGLVGSQTVKALLNMNKKNGSGIHVIALVRSEDKARRIFGTQDGLSFLAQDIADEINCSESVDYIIHAASPTASKFFVSNPVQTIDTAFLGTRNVLEFARKQHVKGVVYLSSMEVYGIANPELEYVTEKDLGYIDILSVRSSYSEGKRICECLCAAYASQYGVPVKIARLAQTFGAGIPYEENRVFAQFAKSAINKTDIVLHTEGRSVGNYCYTRDVIKALLMLLFKGENGQAYTIANEESCIAIRDMAQMVADKIAGGGIKVVFDIPEDSMKYGYAPDVKMHLSSAKMQGLGWKPEIGLLETYERMIGSMQETRGKTE